MNDMTPEVWYKERLAQATQRLQTTNERIRTVSMIRILLFIATICIVYFAWEEKPLTIMAYAACTLIPFIILLRYHTRLFKQKQWLETQSVLIENELKGLQNDFSPFDEGKEFICPDHAYTFDLDIFGRRSLFQAINRTCTQVGKETLAHWLQKHLRDKASIEERQACIQELSQHNEFREQFAITGNMNQTLTSDEMNIKEWISTHDNFTHTTRAKLLVWGVPTTNLLLFALGLFDVLSFNWFGFVFFGFILFSFSIVKRAGVLQEEYTEKLMTLNTYAQLIALLENQSWTAPRLKALSDGIKINGQSPSDALNELSTELSRLELRNNQLLYVVLEGLLFFQLHQMVRIEHWKEKYGHYLEGWIQAVGEIDALCSLGTFAYNHPSYTYPNLSDKPFCFQAEAMGHPLMPTEQCVTNDATLPSRPFFLIITGANMAGKSTYLRTIGTNYLLACIGAPVCCSKLTLYPAQLITSLRTSDSLSENESYFFAELKRLKRIIDLLNQGEELFIILDEILKGTNSIDKQKGSYNLIKQFILARTNGIIATHDLLLGELIHQFPNEIRNYCFEADITNDQLSFSYKIREGVAQNMNACFLMKKMGITFDEQN